jgi:hypothetical protein
MCKPDRVISFRIPVRRNRSSNQLFGEGPENTAYNKLAARVPEAAKLPVAFLQFDL